MSKVNELQKSPASPSRISPGIIEILVMFLITFFLAQLFFNMGDRWVPNQYGPLISITSHFPMLVIPWLWIHFRMRHKNKNTHLWRWTKSSLFPLLIICSWLIPLQILGNLDVIGSPFPGWYRNGWISIMLEILFQGAIVGLCEEMLMRPAIHQSLLLKNYRRLNLFKKWTLSSPLLITAGLFGLLHLGNIGHQRLDYTLFQVIYSFIVGIIIGFYYEKTRNYIGASILHNFIDITGVVMVLIVALFHSL